MAAQTLPSEPSVLDCLATVQAVEQGQGDPFLAPCLDHPAEVGPVSPMVAKRFPLSRPSRSWFRLQMVCEFSSHFLLRQKGSPVTTPPLQGWALVTNSLVDGRAVRHALSDKGVFGTSYDKPYYIL